MCGSGKKRACCCSSSCSEKKKKRVKHEKRPLPDLNCPPPPESSSFSSSPPLPRNYDKLQLLGPTRPHSPAAASRKRKMGMEEAESSSHWMKAGWNKVKNYFISNLKNPNKRKKKDEPAQDKEE